MRHASTRFLEISYIGSVNTAGEMSGNGERKSAATAGGQTGDITDTWTSMARGFDEADHWPYAKPGHWNDPDMMVSANRWGRTFVNQG